MASGNVILDTVKNGESASIRNLVRAMRLMADDKQDEAEEILLSAERELGTGSKVARITGDISFTVPEDSLETWCARLRNEGVYPEMGTHYREHKGCLYKNVIEESYHMDETKHAHHVRDRWHSRHADATQDDLNTSYENAIREARTHNTRARQFASKWELLVREEDNDTRSEDTVVRYQKGDKVPDWFATIRNVSDFGKRRGYTLNHYKAMLDRFVSFFNPEFRVITDRMDADSMASFLSNLNLPDSEFEVIESQIRNLVRQPGAKITSVMSHLKALADMLHSSKPAAEKQNLVYNMMITGLINFTTGATRANLQIAAEHCKRENITIPWETLMEGVIRQESVSGMPATVLSFASAVTPSIMTFNVETGINTEIYGVKPLVSQRTGVKWDTSSNEPFHGQQQYAAPETRMPNWTPYAAPPKVEERVPSTVMGRAEANPVASSGMKSAFLEYMNNSQGRSTDAETLGSGSANTAEELGPAARTRSKAVEPPDSIQADLHQSESFVDLLVTKLFEKQKADRKSRKDNGKKERNEGRFKSKPKGPEKPGRENWKRSDSANFSGGSKSRDTSGSRNTSRSRESSGGSYERTSRKGKKPERPANKTDWSRMEKGNNCHRDYDPKIMKHCHKCMTEGNHHEFACEEFMRRSKYNCSNCHSGFHWADECKQNQLHNKLSGKRDSSRDSQRKGNN